MRIPRKFAVVNSARQVPITIPAIYPTNPVPQVLVDSFLNVNSSPHHDAEVVLDATNVALLKGYPKASTATKFKILYTSPDPTMQAELNLLSERIKAYGPGILPPRKITKNLVKFEMEQARRHRASAQSVLLTLEQHAKGHFEIDSELLTQSLLQPYRLAMEGLKMCLLNLRRFFFPKYLSNADKALILAAPIKANVWDMSETLLDKIRIAAKKQRFRWAPRGNRGYNNRGPARGSRGFQRGFRPRFNYLLVKVNLLTC